MSNADFQFALVLFRENDARHLAQVPIVPDWEPAFEHIRFLGIRRGLRPAEMAAIPVAIEPIWHPRMGHPFLDAFRLVLDGTPAVADDLPTAYLNPLARQAVASLIEAGTISATDRVRYLVCALPATPAEEVAASGLVFEDLPQPLPLCPSRLADTLGPRSAQVGAPWDANDLPVVIPEPVIAETHAQSRAADTHETGGILIGTLHRDPESAELFVEVTAQLPAKHTIAHEARLTFTDETWAAARTDVADRGDGTIILGWWHYHPFFCRNCPPKRRATCSLDSTFFSRDDVHLHRVCFNQPYAVALLISQRPTELTTALFGWRRATVESRGFYTKGELSHASHPTC